MYAASWSYPSVHQYYVIFGTTAKSRWNKVTMYNQPVTTVRENLAVEISYQLNKMTDLSIPMVHERLDNSKQCKIVLHILANERVMGCHSFCSQEQNECVEIVERPDRIFINWMFPKHPSERFDSQLYNDPVLWRGLVFSCTLGPQYGTCGEFHLRRTGILNTSSFSEMSRKSANFTRALWLRVIVSSRSIVNACQSSLTIQ